jgi:hypothetical protein
MLGQKDKHVFFVISTVRGRSHLSRKEREYSKVLNHRDFSLRGIRIILQDHERYVYNDRRFFVVLKPHPFADEIACLALGILYGKIV